MRCGNRLESPASRHGGTRGYHVQQHRSITRSPEGGQGRHADGAANGCGASRGPSHCSRLQALLWLDTADTLPIATPVCVPCAIGHAAMARRSRMGAPAEAACPLETEALPDRLMDTTPTRCRASSCPWDGRWASWASWPFNVCRCHCPGSPSPWGPGVHCGLCVSCKAYRASLAHPELYPRYAPRAARFVSIGFLAPIVLYVGLVLLVLLFVGGFGLL